MTDHRPTRLPETLSARDWRTPLSIDLGSEGRGWRDFLEEYASTVAGPFGRYSWSFFCKPYSRRTRATLRVLTGETVWRIFWAMTSAEASGSRKRWRMTSRVTSGVRRVAALGPGLRLSSARQPPSRKAARSWY